MTPTRIVVDGNEAVARVAYALSEAIAIYPITPASPMGEAADAWSAEGRPNLWGGVPRVVEMQSEAGAAGALHGAVTSGVLGTTFTASQGLLLMLPDMYKIAGELTPAVIHVAARTVATHALSIFGDHSDVMGVRASGFAMLASSSVQEAQDFALIAHAAALRARVPFVHFFDGFRTSHEVATIDPLDDDDLRALVRDADVLAHRARGLSPDRPVLRGSAQNPDAFFQSREASTPYHAAVPGIVRDLFDELANRTGRRYGLVDYVGAPDADRVVVLMGSGTGAAAETVTRLCTRGQKVGLLTVRLFRPFPADALIRALPATVRAVAVLDRTKEPGATSEPLHADVMTALWEAGRRNVEVIGGRYGLASKEFTPGMVKAVYDELSRPEPRRRITVGIVDDVSGTSVVADRSFRSYQPGTVSAVFYGLGSDGTVGANKLAAKLVGTHTGLFAQGYFVYDSKKSGSLTVSHLRFAPRPITSTYLVEQADFVACHQFGFLDRYDVLSVAAPGATFLLNSPYPADEVWDHLPTEVQEAILDKGLALYVVDAAALARKVGLGGRINSVMLPCFFALSRVLPRDEALAALKEALAETYAHRGETVVERNLAAVDRALAALAPVAVPEQVTATRSQRSAVPDHAPEFVRSVTGPLLAGRGDELPVSALPADGTFPTGTAQWEKRAIGAEIPVWDPSICVDCGKCTLVCPHAAIRMTVCDPAALSAAPDGFPSKTFAVREAPGLALAITVSPDDCTGCGVCVDVCPAVARTEPRHRSIEMAPVAEHRERQQAWWSFAAGIPPMDPPPIPPNTVKGSQIRQPLFEFSGACAGCGETPYLKLLTQLFGDRLMVANATGCSSIFGGNLPTTPWSTDPAGRGPAWSNSLFEDNAEFGLGMRIAVDHRGALARTLVERLTPQIGADLADDILGADQSSEPGIAAQRRRVAELRHRLAQLDGTADIASLREVADDLVRRSVWLVGGDGWAYDIGSAGLDHVLASGENVNVLVLDTEVYSNTGGQASKATPRGAVAKFAASGKRTPKKDLGLLAMAYGSVYVAQVALGGNDVHTVRALLEAEAWPGPSLVIAYSTCIAHGIDMSRSMSHQKDAVRSGYWPLYRYHPGDAHPLRLDSAEPSMPVGQFTESETRFAAPAASATGQGGQLGELLQSDVTERWQHYQQLADIEWSHEAI